MECDALSNQLIENLLLCRHHVQQYLFYFSCTRETQVAEDLQCEMCPRKRIE